MPRKDKRKNKNDRRGNTGHDDDDTDSISSDLTDFSLTSEDDPAQLEAETFENKFLEAMELAQGKSATTRVNSLISLRTALKKRILTGFLVNHYQTLADIIEKSLRKGKGQEQVAAAKLTAVFVISLQDGSEAQQVFNILYPALAVIVKDPSACLAARKEVASAIAIVSFLACPDPSDLPGILNILHDVFCGSLPKGNGELPTLSAGMLDLHCAALSGVCLLMTLLSATTIYGMAQKMLEEMTPVLDTPDTDLRIAVGEALAIIHESAKRHNADFRWRREQAVIERLEKFVNNSQKYLAKKDRRVQRSSFREIIQTIENGEPIDMSVSIGPKNEEELLIDSWAVRFQYQAVCYALEQGCALHMSGNGMIRQLFDLGPPQPLGRLKTASKGPKRSSKQTPEVKARLLFRGKNRDNRQNALEYED